MNSDFIIRTAESFNRSAKKLYKKYPSPAKGLLSLKKDLLKDPTSGIPLGKDCYKIRMSITSKGKGKSGGARVVTYVKNKDKLITLLDLYDKPDKESITEKELARLIVKAG